MINFHRVKVELQEIIENFLELFGTFIFEKTSGCLLKITFLFLVWLIKE